MDCLTFPTWKARQEIMYAVRGKAVRSCRLRGHVGKVTGQLIISLRLDVGMSLCKIPLGHFCKV